MTRKVRFLFRLAALADRNLAWTSRSPAEVRSSPGTRIIPPCRSRRRATRQPTEVKVHSPQCFRSVRECHARVYRYPQSASDCRETMLATMRWLMALILSRA